VKGVNRFLVVGFALVLVGICVVQECLFILAAFCLVYHGVKVSGWFGDLLTLSKEVASVVEAVYSFVMTLDIIAS
jgi:hypothetical protein